MSSADDPCIVCGKRVGYDEDGWTFHPYCSYDCMLAAVEIFLTEIL